MKLDLRKLGLLSAMALAATAMGAHAQDAWTMGDPYAFNVAGSQPQHSIYAVGVAHKQIIEEALPGVTLNITATQGGAENIELIVIGEANLANANSIAAIAADRGLGQFEGMGAEGIVLGFFPGYTAELGAVVPADSDVQTFRDLVGRSIALGPVGSGAEATATNALAAIGLKDDDFERVQRAAPSQGFASLAAGQVDAFVWGTAHPAGLYLENQSTQDLRFIPFTEEDLQTIAEELPGQHVGAVRAGTYRDQDEAVAWIGGSTHFWVSSEIPEDLVYEMVRALWENRERLAAAHASQAYLTEDLVRQQATLVPYHPGAQRYFVEQGILTD